MYSFVDSTTTPKKGLRKVGIIGTGQVGMAIAYAMLIETLAEELVLVDVVPEKAEGEAMDLLHGLPFAKPMSIRAGGLDVCEGVDLVIITAGAKRKPGETRLDLMQRNVGIFSSLMPPLVKQNPNAIFLVVSNPVDIMTYIAWKLSGLPRSSVLGSGTILDTARFRSMLSKRIGIDSRNVHAYIIGEHGDSEVAVWSRVNVSGVSLQSFYDSEELGASWEEIATQVKLAAQEVIKRKGATCYAIGLGVTRLTQAILQDQHHVMTCSCMIDGPYGIKDVFLSLPAVIGRQGVHNVLALDLAPNEEAALIHSADVLRSALDDLGY
jgi:L-lactate dehydrogenase